MTRKKQKKKQCWNHCTSSCKRVKMMTVMLMKKDNIPMHAQIHSTTVNQKNFPATVLSNNCPYFLWAFQILLYFWQSDDSLSLSILIQMFSSTILLYLSLDHTVIHCCSGALKQRLGTIVVVQNIVTK